jgi:hypothetical protein
MKKYIKRQLIENLDDIKRIRYEVSSIRMTLLACVCINLSLLMSIAGLFSAWFFIHTGIMACWVYTFIFCFFAFIFLGLYFYLLGLIDNRQIEFLLKHGNDKKRV